MRLRRKRIPRELPTLGFLTVLCLAFSLANKNFATAANLRTLGADAATTCILAVGMTAVILTGGIDLSVAAVLSLATLAAASLMAKGLTAQGLVASALVGAGCGFFNGVLITRIFMPPIIATLGTMYVFQSAAALASGGQCIVLEHNPIAFLGKGFVPLLVLLGTTLFAAGVLQYTRVGRYIYAVGGCEESTRLSGIDPNVIKILVYTANGLLAALGGIVMLGIGSTFQANDAQGYELAAIAAVVIGGTSINGGQGSVLGTLLGIAITTVLRNGAILAGLEARWAQAIVGLAIFLAVAVDKIRREDTTR
ncbi:MAG: ABC transporter permease [Armatimonadota bacterium]|nr:ABC transporter permease [Armatimonadota bacterium]